MIYTHFMMCIFSMLFMKHLGYSYFTFESIALLIAVNIHFGLGWIAGGKVGNP